MANVRLNVALDKYGKPCMSSFSNKTYLRKHSVRKLRIHCAHVHFLLVPAQHNSNCASVRITNQITHV
jgi:hypothetical protein